LFIGKTNSARHLQTAISKIERNIPKVMHFWGKSSARNIKLLQEKFK